MNELNKLLSVNKGEVDGILQLFEPKDCFNQDNVNFTFHYVRFQNNEPRTKDFINKLLDHIVSYCLNRDKYQNISPQDVRKLWYEAKQKFASPKDGKTGEPGELVTFFLLEGILNAPKIFSKMSLKTNRQMHIHGSDGVHLRVNGDDIVLFFGESKLYQVHTTAISDALSSVKDFVSSNNSSSNNQQDFEIQVLSDHLDLPEGETRELILKVLDPYSKERSNLQYVYTCFIGFDINELKANCKPENFELVYNSKAKSCYENVLKKIEADAVLKKLSWQFFFIPFGSVVDFRNEFLSRLEI